MLYHIVVVWGEEYRESLLNISLPSFLSPNNLPGLVALKKSRFIFVTTKKDWEVLLETKIFQYLKSLINVLFFELPTSQEFTRLSVHEKMSLGYKLATDEAIKKGAYCVYLTPDCIVCDGALTALERLAFSGKKAVMAVGLRLAKETFIKDLEHNGKLNSGMPLIVSSRELVRLGLKNLHPETKCYNWNNNYFTSTPHMITWNIPGEQGLLIRSFHLHPLLVKVSDFQDKLNFDITNTIDGNFLGYNIFNWDEIHIESDSDNIVVFFIN